MTATTTATDPRPDRFGDRPQLAGAAAAGLSMLLLGSSAPVASTIDQVPILTGQAARYLIAATQLVPALVLARRILGPRRPVAGRPTAQVRMTGRDLVQFMLLGVFGIAGFNLFLVSASYRVAPALVGAVLAATPVLLAVIGPLLARRRPSARCLAGAATVSVGTAVITGLGATDPLGILLCLGALACELAYTLLAIRLIDRFGTFATTTGAVVSGAGVLLVGALLIDGATGFVDLLGNPGDLAAVAYLAIAVAIVANLAWYLALPRLGTAKTGLFYAFSPVGALLASLILGAALPGPIGLVGLAVIALGLIIGVWPRRTG